MRGGEDPGHVENNMHENREDLQSVYLNGRPARGGAEPQCGHARNAGVGPLRSTVKQPDNEGQPSARQRREGGSQGERRANQYSTDTARSTSVPRFERRARAARERKQEQFTALLHHVTVNLLRESFDALKKNAAHGWMA